MLHFLMSIPAGIAAWNIVEPESFFGAIGFLIVWGILDYVFGIALAFIIAILSSLFNGE